MKHFSGFRIIDKLSESTSLVLAAVAARPGDVPKARYLYSSHRWPALAAALVEEKSPTQFVATIIYCPRNEAKRLVYPVTNKHRGLRCTVSTRYLNRGSHVYYFAKNFDDADRYVRIKSGCAIDSSAQIAEMNRVLNYMAENVEWPALITPVEALIGQMTYFLVVDRDTAASFVYIGKDQYRSKAKHAGTITGRLTADGQVLRWTDTWDDLVENHTRRGR